MSFGMRMTIRAMARQERERAKAYRRNDKREQKAQRKAAKKEGDHG